MTNRIRWSLWLVTVSVAALAATQWWWSSPDDTVVSTPALVVAVAPMPVIPPASIPATAKPIDAAPSASAFKLVGTVVAANGADSFALVRRTADSQVVRLRTGDRLEGLTVRAIESNTVVLAGAGQPVVIEADRTVAPPQPSRAVGPAPDVEPAWAGDPEPFGH